MTHESFRPSPSYTYDDIGLVPCTRSDIRSRKTGIDTSVDFLGIKLRAPILVAPMETVVGVEMAKAIWKLGGLAILPRTNDQEKYLDIIYEVGNVIGYENVIPSISTHADTSNVIGKAHKDIRIICIDVANGFHINIAETVKKIKKKWPELKIIAGNVASVEGYKFLTEIGVDAVRIGIGPGSVCTTSVATGIRVGQASIVRETAMWKKEAPWEIYNNGMGRRPPIKLEYELPLIIADGGIKSPGCVMKAISLGADLVMAGGIFAGAEESPGRVIKLGDQKYKHFAGQASMFVKGQNEYVEGADRLVPYTKSVEKTWKAFEQGIRSGMAYMNCTDLSELRYQPDNCFTYLSNASKAERKVHA